MEINEEILQEIKKESLEEHVPIIMDCTLEYILKYLKDENICVKKILEIGTATGYSASCFAKLDTVEKIDTIERDEKRYLKASENIKKLNLEDVVKIHFGDAQEILPKIHDKYDLIFIDGAKSKYSFFLEYCLKYLNKEGVIFADNILFKGYVLSSYNEHKHRTAVRNLREFIQKIKEDENLKSEVIQIRDGLGVIRWKK